MTFTIPCNVQIRVSPSSDVSFKRVDGVPITSLDNCPVQLVRSPLGTTCFRVYQRDEERFCDFLNTTRGFSMNGPTPCLDVDGSQNDEHGVDKRGRILLKGSLFGFVLLVPEDMGNGYRAWPSATPFCSRHIDVSEDGISRHPVLTRLHEDSKYRPEASWLRSQRADEVVSAHHIQYDVKIIEDIWDVDDKTITPFQYPPEVKMVTVRFASPDEVAIVPIAANKLRAILKRACGNLNPHISVWLAGLNGRYGVVAGPDISDVYGDVEKFTRQCLSEFWRENVDRTAAFYGDRILRPLARQLAYDDECVIFHG